MGCELHHLGHHHDRRLAQWQYLLAAISAIVQLKLYGPAALMR